MVLRVAEKYNIQPAVIGALSNPWTKDTWKEFTRQAVGSHWMAELVSGAECKSSLQYLDLTDIRPNAAHHLWPRGGSSSGKRVAASFRAKLISGSYILQTNRARFNQNKVNPTCPLCKSAPEDLPHFLLSCPSLAPPREKLLPRIRTLAKEIGLQLPQDTPSQCKTLLNAPNPETCCVCAGRKKDRSPPKCKCVTMCELINELCLKLHNCRTQVLSLSGKGS